MSPLIHSTTTLRFPAFGTQVQGASKRAYLGSGFYGFSTSDLVSDEHKRWKEGKRFRGDYGQEPHGSGWTRTAGHHVIQDCNVNMQFGGATSRDVARQADQYGLSLALLYPRC